MATIANLEVALGMDAAEFTKGARNATTSLDGMSKSLQRQIDTFGMSSRASKIYLMEQKGASAASVAAARASDAALTKLEAQAKATAAGAGVFDRTRTAAEKYASEIARLNDLLKQGAINQDTFNRAATQAKNTRMGVGGGGELGGMAARFGLPSFGGGGLAIAAAPLAGVAGLGKLAAAQMQAIDTSAKLSDAIGINMEKLAGLGLAAELSGSNMEGLSDALVKMEKNIGAAKEGTGPASDALVKLGLDADALAKMDPGDAFAAIADGFKKLNGVDRVTVAMELFGKAGAKMIPTLMLGSEGLKKSADEAARLGLTVSRFDAKKIEEANDAVTKAEKAWQGLGNTLAVSFASGKKLVADFATDAIVSMRRLYDLLDDTKSKRADAKSPLGPTAEMMADDAERMKNAADKAKAAAEKTSSALNALQREADTFGMSPGMKKYIELIQGGATTERATEGKRLVEQIEAMKDAEKNAADAARTRDTIAGLSKEAAQLDMSPLEKAMDDAARATDTSTEAGKNALAEIQARIAALFQLRDAAKAEAAAEDYRAQRTNAATAIIQENEKRRRQAGMTAEQKRLDDIEYGDYGRDAGRVKTSEIGATAAEKADAASKALENLREKHKDLTRTAGEKAEADALRSGYSAEAAKAIGEETQAIEDQTAAMKENNKAAKADRIHGLSNAALSLALENGGASRGNRGGSTLVRGTGTRGDVVVASKTSAGSRDISTATKAAITIKDMDKAVGFLDRIATASEKFTVAYGA